jgi:uncharacterized YigZ family protein
MPLISAEVDHGHRAVEKALMSTGITENDPDIYLTLARPYEATLTVKASRFIARVAPASSVERAEHFINTVRREYHDAGHHCFAFRLGYATTQIERFSDAGEPSGTAGRPILEVIQAKKVWDVTAVVTRWFGGVKLGTGGLKRAYAETAAAALDETTLISRLVISAYDLRFDHELTGVVYRVINEFKALIPSTDFGKRIRMGVTVKRSKGPAFCARLIDAGRGAIDIRHVGEGVR